MFLGPSAGGSADSGQWVLTCTLADWQRWLPAALGIERLPEEVILQAHITLPLEEGELHLDWKELPERRLGLIRLPQLRAEFVWINVPQKVRVKFAKNFDLQLQRGGG